jgi:hypothetical protein
MHRCRATDTHDCNAWCHDDIHVDLAYCHPEVLATSAYGPLESFSLAHLLAHLATQTVPCQILAVTPAPEAPPLEARYPQDVDSPVVAFRVTYRLPREEPTL